MLWISVLVGPCRASSACTCRGSSISPRARPSSCVSTSLFAITYLVNGARGPGGSGRRSAHLGAPQDRPPGRANPSRVRSRALLSLALLLAPFLGWRRRPGRRSPRPSIISARSSSARRLPSTGAPARRGWPPSPTTRPDGSPRAGYQVVRQDFAFTRYVDRLHAPAMQPMLERVVDGYDFKVESAFNLQKTRPGVGHHLPRASRSPTSGPATAASSRSATRAPSGRTRRSCRVGADLDAIVAAGGAGAVVQGDDEAAPRVRAELAPAAPDGRRGAPTKSRSSAHEVTAPRDGRASSPATGRNVLGVRRPPAGASAVRGAARSRGRVVPGRRRQRRGRGRRPASRGDPRRRAAGHRHRRRLMDAEEVGLIGAERFARGARRRARPSATADRRSRTDDVKAVVNLDASSARASDVQGMTAARRRGATCRSSSGARWSLSEEPLLQAAFLARFAAHGVLGLPIPSSVFAPVGAGEIGGRLRSDVASLRERGIPFVWPVSGYPEYHTDGDTLATVVSRRPRERWRRRPSISPRTSRCCRSGA